eukprot:scaffold147022_cov22-Tisochrysis_lutea.AAC.1
MSELSPRTCACVRVCVCVRPLIPFSLYAYLLVHAHKCTVHEITHPHPHTLGKFKAAGDRRNYNVWQNNQRFEASPGKPGKSDEICRKLPTARWSKF